MTAPYTAQAQQAHAKAMAAPPVGTRRLKKAPHSERGTNSGKPPRIEIHCRDCCRTPVHTGSTCVTKGKWTCGGQHYVGLRALKCPRGHAVPKDGYTP